MHKMVIASGLLVVLGTACAENSYVRRREEIRQYNAQRTATPAVDEAAAPTTPTPKG